MLQDNMDSRGVVRQYVYGGEERTEALKLSIPEAGTYLPQSYLIHEQMVVTDRIENVDQLGVFIRRLCQDKETYKLQRREPIRGRQKRSTDGCLKIVHFENRFAVETEICQ